MLILLSEQKFRQSQTNPEKFLKLRSEKGSFSICIKFGLSLIARIIKLRSNSICINQEIMVVKSVHYLSREIYSYRKSICLRERKFSMFSRSQDAFLEVSS